jgi:hypothetical protein
MNLFGLFALLSNYLRAASSKLSATLKNAMELCKVEGTELSHCHINLFTFQIWDPAKRR